jgi:perosamine synthetase
MIHMSDNVIPLGKAELGPEEEQAVLETLRSGWLIHGDKNKQFEDQFKNYLGVKHALTMNSCTSALFLAVLAHDITGEVIVPSFTFSASANAIVTAGATPVFADVYEDTAMLDPMSVEQCITDNTQAIMVVHFAGQSADLDPLVALCKKYNLVLIEDSAEAVGATYKGRRTGSTGTGCFSFYPTKNLTTAEGGMLTTHDEALAERVELLMAHGIKKVEHAPFVGYRSASIAGYNFRLPNVLATIGVEQMKKIDRFNMRRRELATLYNARLASINGITTPVEKEGRMHTYQMYTIRVADAVRNILVAHLNKQGIKASVHFSPPVHLQEFYKDFEQRVPLTVTEKIHKEIITLPLFTEMTTEQVHRVCDVIERFMDKRV